MDYWIDGPTAIRPSVDPPIHVNGMPETDCSGWLAPGGEYQNEKM